MDWREDWLKSTKRRRRGRLPPSPNTKLKMRDEMKAEHRRKERERHRSVSALTDELCNMVPMDYGPPSSRVKQLEMTVRYFLYLEEVIRDVCAAKNVPVPPRCQLMSHPSEETQEVHTSRSLIFYALDQLITFIKQENREEAKRKFDSDDDSNLPDLELERAVREIQEYNKQNHQGISEEDWNAAGSSQQSQPQIAYVDIVCDPTHIPPLREAPEYFVVPYSEVCGAVQIAP
ncbi:uncharacterized protein LOC135397173 isoform X1 [Ornithodoros turicata]|uniref:uncharacterized protein LOC135397173 isoform X1 n=1 Tax=Ornithodoros turicata TaxID=34597 RepID=UPI0031396A6E